MYFKEFFLRLSLAYELFRSGWFNFHIFRKFSTVILLLISVSIPSWPDNGVYVGTIILSICICLSLAFVSFLNLIHIIRKAKLQ